MCLWARTTTSRARALPVQADALRWAHHVPGLDELRKRRPHELRLLLSSQLSQRIVLRSIDESSSFRHPAAHDPFGTTSAG